MVALGDKVSPADVEEGMRVAIERTKLSIQLPLPPKIDPSVTMMTVEEKPDITYAELGGCKEQIEKIREVVEKPLLHVRPHKSHHTHPSNYQLIGCFVAAGAVCGAGHRPAQGRPPLWPPRCATTIPIHVVSSSS